ncbi:receptor-like protein 7 [Euphorbia lathyris]|uniref:receptor-like protein 7 n=1 Tax=Euphorbia lathyris TaxID=212925 RepID=UPI0033134236
MASNRILLILSMMLNLVICYSSICHDNERSALLKFKESFSVKCDDSGYAKVASWPIQGRETSNCCSWNGVQCSNETGHVIALDLSTSCLFGSINSSSTLFLLVHLRRLDLSFNNFNYSRIPSGIRNLSSLTHLNLSVSNFSDQIPSEILQLSNLVSLDLSENPLKLQTPGLKDVAENLTSLTTLHLSGVTIASEVPRSLAKLSSLSSLLLKDCSLEGEFPGEMFQLRFLRYLSVRWNGNLTGYLPEFEVGSSLEMLMLDGTNFTGQIPSSIRNLQSLKSLTASGCLFSGQLPSSLGNLSKLNFLDFSRNNLSGKIPSSLSNLHELGYLSISFNNFSPGNLYWLGNLTNLFFLDLKSTNSHGEIPFSLSNLTQLTHLWLSTNFLNGTIPTWLGNFTQSIQLSNNLLHGSVPESIFDFPNLQELELQFNHLSGNLKLDSVLKSVNLVDLQLSENHLSLTGNPNTNISLPKFQILGLSTCNLTEFPNFLQFQDSLKFLDLSQNKIEGLVPSWISKLGPETLGILNLASNYLTGFEQPLLHLPWTNLHVLNLTSNNLQGSLPIPPLSIFIYLVSNNKLSGQLSPMICNLPYLLTLDVSNNNLSGNLPRCFGDLINSASVLNLQNNSLSGKIPDRYTSGCTLKMIDFGRNELEGKIPRSLSNCTELDTLSLGNNKINDIFPSWLGVLANLKVLILRSNKLRGVIGKPEANSEFPSLQVIDLSDNNFTGKLPLEYFRNWKAMSSVDKKRLAYMHVDTSFQISNYSWSNYYTYSIIMSNKGINIEYEKIPRFFVAMDLSSNKFEGEIPGAIGNLRELLLLNLSNNVLARHIPSTLGNLQQLEALDLSMNKLSGNIPMQLTQLSFLAFFNVSRNNLTGLIPRGNQFNTFENSSYDWNSGLCGNPLSRKCEDSDSRMPLAPPQPEDGAEFEFGWKVVLMGFASGLVIGVAIECTVNTRKNIDKWQAKLTRFKCKLWRN